jgi:hypothetical protein
LQLAARILFERGLLIARRRCRDDLSWRQARELVAQLLMAFGFAETQLERREIERGDTEQPSSQIRAERHQVVIAARIELLFVDDHAGCHDLDDLALDGTFSQLGVFDLVANRHLVAEVDQLADVASSRVVGTPHIGIGSAFFLSREVSVKSSASDATLASSKNIS